MLHFNVLLKQDALNQKKGHLKYLENQIIKEECGGCKHWMTSFCKVENEHHLNQNNNSGYKKFIISYIDTPSSYNCNNFQLSSQQQSLIKQWKDERNILISEINNQSKQSGE